LEKVARDRSNQPVFRVGEKEQEGDNWSSNVSPEQQLVGMIVAYPEVRKAVWKKLKKSYLLAEDVKALYNVVHGLAKGDKGFAQLSADDLIAKIPDEKVSLAEGLRRISEERLGQSQVDVLSEGQALLCVVKRRWLEKELVRLQSEMAAGTKVKREEALEKFNRRRRELSEVNV